MEEEVSDDKPEDDENRHKVRQRDLVVRHGALNL